MVQTGISTFKASHSFNRLGQGLLNPVRYHRQSQEFPRPLLHKTSPRTLQQTPFLYRTLPVNALKIILSATQENCLSSFILLLQYLLHCQLQTWASIWQTNLSNSILHPLLFVPNTYQITGHSRQMEDLFIPGRYKIPWVSSQPKRSAHFNTF